MEGVTPPELFMAELSVKNIVKCLQRAAGWIMRPVIKEFNFFFVIWLINSSVTLGNLVGCLIYPENDLGQSLRCLALATAVSYFLTVLLHLMRRRWLRGAFKWLCYVVLIGLGAVYVFLMLQL